MDRITTTSEVRVTRLHTYYICNFLIQLLSGRPFPSSGSNPNALSHLWNKSLPDSIYAWYEARVSSFPSALAALRLGASRSLVLLNTSACDPPLVLRSRAKTHLLLSRATPFQ